jgi:hypothetical protein
MFRGLIIGDSSEQEKQLDLLRGLFGGLPHAEVTSFIDALNARSIQHREDVLPSLRADADLQFVEAQRRGVRNPDAPTPREVQLPSWSEYSLARDRSRRAVDLVQLQERAVKTMKEFVSRRRGVLGRVPPKDIGHSGGTRKEDVSGSTGASRRSSAGSAGGGV